METLGKMLHMLAEALAIFKAIKYTISEINNNNITIYSDSVNLTWVKGSVSRYL
jgi:hypothetical protein